MQPLEPDDPAQIGDYRLLGRLGEGGMGIVYFGRSPGGQAVAVKVLRERFARDAEFRGRFRREMVAAGTVTGTFTAPLLSAAPDADVPWLATEYLPGLSLREAVQTFGPLPPAAVRLLAAALAEALADIHRAGLTHRDLKPGNVMLTPSGPRVIDFGIARPQHATSITIPGALFGTPSFMSPEQASGGVAGPAADVFALGAVLAYAATGQRPFDGADTASTLERIRLAHADLSGLTDPGLRAIIAACLRRRPGWRPSAAGLLRRLGEPEASVQGTRWLPPQLAEAIDRRAAPAGPAPHTAEVPGQKPAALAGSAALPGQATADPGSVTADPGSVTADPGSAMLPPARRFRIPIPQDPGRRRLLLAVAALPVAAGAAALADSLLSPSDRPTSAGSSGSSRTPSPVRPTASLPPPQAVRVWTSQVFDGEGQCPDLYTAGGVVFAADTIKTDVRALDCRTGKLLWSREVNVGPPHKVNVGPGVVYLFEPTDASMSIMHAVDPASGAIRWTSRLELGFAWGMAATGPAACIAIGNEIRAFNASDGRARWTAQATGMTIAADAGLVVAAGDNVLSGLDAATGRIRWTHRTDFPPMDPQIAGGLVFARDTYGILYVVRADDGKAVWQKQLNYNSSAHPAGSMIFVDERVGQVHALRAETGEQVWSRQLGYGVENPYGESSVLAASDDTVWMGSTDRTVYALHTADGSVRWTYEADAAGSSGSTVVTTSGWVFIGTYGGRVEAVNPPRSGGRNAAK